MQFIDLKKQLSLIEKEVHKNIENVLQHGQFILGPEVKELEKQLEQFTGAKYCLGVGSGTDALQVALMALDIKPGDEVITTTFSFIATATMITLLGAKPVFVDIDEKTYNIDHEQIEKVITHKTKAIIAVDLYGQCADYEKISALADKHNIHLIADAAQSLGASFKGKKAGTFGKISCTSFYPAKPFGAYGEGGACFTDDAKLAEELRKIHAHGQSKTYEHECLGINARLDTLQAAILLAKFPLLEGEINQRQEIAKKYQQRLDKIVTTPYIQQDSISAYAQYTILIENRDEFRKHMQQKSIPTAVHYPKPLHLQPVFNYLNYKVGDFPIAERIAKQVVSLPMHPYLSDADIDKISEEIINFKKLSAEIVA